MTYSCYFNSNSWHRLCVMIMHARNTFRYGLTASSAKTSKRRLLHVQPNRRYKRHVLYHHHWQFDPGAVLQLLLGWTPGRLDAEQCQLLVWLSMQQQWLAHWMWQPCWSASKAPEWAAWSSEWMSSSCCYPQTGPPLHSGTSLFEICLKHIRTATEQWMFNERLPYKHTGLHPTATELVT